MTGLRADVAACAREDGRLRRRGVLAAGVAWPLASLASLADAAAPAATAASAPSAAGLRQDADVLQRVVETLHPGLYRYGTPAQVAGRFDVLRDELSGATGSEAWLARAFLAFSRLTASIRCGHTYANFNNQSAPVQRAILQASGCLPFEFRWIGRRMIVTRDLTAERCLPPGTEVVRIDGLACAELLTRLLPFVRADGANDAKRIALLEVRGLDRVETFDVFLGLVRPLGERAWLDVVPPGQDRPRGFAVGVLSHARRLDAMHVPTADERHGWRFERLDGDIALLRMPSWALYDSRWDWRSFLATCFEGLAARPTQALVIDLRGNEGGVEVGDEILPWLVDRPTALRRAPRMVRYRDVPDDLERFLDTWDDGFRHWGDAARRVDDRFFRLQRGDEDVDLRTIRPRPARYAGRVFVLIGPENSSATFQFARDVREAALGTLVGRATGGNLRGINGGAFFFVRLPTSGIEVDLPLIATFEPGDLPDAGLEPDLAVVPTPSGITAGIDEDMAAVRQLLAGGSARGDRQPGAGATLRTPAAGEAPQSPS